MRARILMIVSAVAWMAVAPTSTSSAATTPRSFYYPGAVALDHDGHVWVTNSGTHGVTEVAATTGVVVRRIDGRNDGFNNPTAIAVDGRHVWVVSGGVVFHNGTSNGRTVTEIDARSGRVLRVITLKPEGLAGLSGVSVDGSHVWVCADGGSRVVMLSNTTGRVLHVYRNGEGLPNYASIDSLGPHVWIVSPEAPDSGVVERSNTTGRWIRRINVSVKERMKGLSHEVTTYVAPDVVVEDAHHLWFVNDYGTKSGVDEGSLSEIDPTTGHVIRIVNINADRYPSPTSAVVSGGDLWIANGIVSAKHRTYGNRITEVNESTRRVVRVIALGGRDPDVGKMAASASDVWVSDRGGGAQDGGSLLEIDATTGVVVRSVG